MNNIATAITSPTRRFTPKTVLLQGEPGAGKSMMAGLTAINKPVHFIDVDRKTASAAWATQAIADARITVWELAEPTDASNLKARMLSLVKKGKPDSEPKGWINFAEYVYKMPQTEEFKRCGTLCVDSLTLLNAHLKTHIMYLSERSKFTFDQWNALKIGWEGTISTLCDTAKENGKDLILTVHERPGEIAGERTTGVIYGKDSEGNKTRQFTGTLDVKIWSSIDGATGQIIGASMDEFYHLYVKMENEKPTWVCRVWPDGRRNLRTSFKVGQAEFKPDFREIWK